MPSEGNAPPLRAVASYSLTQHSQTLPWPGVALGSGSPERKGADSSSSYTVHGDEECFHVLCLFRVGRL